MQLQPQNMENLIADIYTEIRYSMDEQSYFALLDNVDNQIQNQLKGQLLSQMNRQFYISLKLR